LHPLAGWHDPARLTGPIAAAGATPIALGATTHLSALALPGPELSAQLRHLLLSQPDALLVGEDGTDPLAKGLLSRRRCLPLPRLPLLTKLLGSDRPGTELGLHLEHLGHAVPLGRDALLPERLEAGDLGFGQGQLLLHAQERLGREPRFGTALHRGSIGPLALRSRCGRTGLGRGPAGRGLLGGCGDGNRHQQAKGSCISCTHIGILTLGAVVRPGVDSFQR